MVPVVFIVSIALAIDYSALSQKSLGFILALVVATQMVGWGEEGMFRGIGVVTLRDHGLTEGKVALWSSVIFGAVHITNLIDQGAYVGSGAAILAYLVCGLLLLVVVAASSRSCTPTSRKHAPHDIGTCARIRMCAHRSGRGRPQPHGVLSRYGVIQAS